MGCRDVRIMSHIRPETSGCIGVSTPAKAWIPWEQQDTSQVLYTGLRIHSTMLSRLKHTESAAVSACLSAMEASHCPVVAGVPWPQNGREVALLELGASKAQALTPQ